MCFILLSFQRIDVLKRANSKTREIRYKRVIIKKETEIIVFWLKHNKNWLKQRKNHNKTLLETENIKRLQSNWRGSKLKFTMNE